MPARMGMTAPDREGSQLVLLPSHLAVRMLASRSQHHAFAADKENSHAPPATSRKAAGTLGGSSMTAGPAFKTPGGAKSQLLAGNNARTAFKQQQQRDDKGKLAMTVAAEPGARILGAKDVNNRKQQSQTARKPQGSKGKEAENAEIRTLLPL